MTKKPKSKSLIRSLTWTYLLFPLAVSLFFLLAVILGAALFMQQLQDPGRQGFDRQLANLASGRYDRFPIRELTSDQTVFAILDQTGQAVYTSAGAGLDQLTPEELSLIEELGAGFSTSEELTAFTNREGQQQYLLTRRRFKSRKLFFGLVTLSEDPDREETSQLVLDQAFRVQSSNTFRRGVSLKNLALLIQQGHVIRKYSFQAADGQPMTLVYYSSVQKGITEVAMPVLLGLAILVFIGAYLLLSLGFALWINRKVKRPLSQLGRAVNRLRDKKGELIEDYRGPAEFVQIIEDVNQVAADLQQTEAARQQLQLEKQEMLANISHDLKTPITVIHGYTRAMRDGLVPPESQERYLEAINQKSQRLTDLIMAFHDYSMIEHPDFSLSLQQLDISALIRNYADQHREEVELGGYRLELTGLADGPLFCALDASQFERVLDNLLANFFKHSRTASRLLLGLERQGQQVQVLVADDGQGIAPETGQQLFRPFVTSEAARGSQSGSGLGLAIAQKIISQHGGSIQLEYPPRPPYRTVFLIRLPLGEEPPAAL